MYRANVPTYSKFKITNINVQKKIDLPPPPPKKNRLGEEI